MGGVCRYCGVKVSNKHYSRCRSCMARDINRQRVERRVSRVRTLSECEAAWVGAMIEGEGCISFTRHTEPVVMVSNTSVETIATMLRLVGSGSVYRTVAGRETPLWRWSLCAISDLRAALPQVIPFLTDKRERALVMLESVSCPRS